MFAAQDELLCYVLLAKKTPPPPPQTCFGASAAVVKVSCNSQASDFATALSASGSKTAESGMYGKHADHRVRNEMIGGKWPRVLLGCAAS